MELLKISLVPLAPVKLSKKLSCFDKELLSNLKEATSRTVGLLDPVVFGFIHLDRPTFFIKDYARDPGFIGALATSVAATFTFYISKLEKVKEPIVFCNNNFVPQALYDTRSLVGYIKLSRELGNYGVQKIWEKLRNNKVKEPVFDGMEDTLIEIQELDPFLLNGFGVSKGNIFIGEDVEDIVNVNLPRRTT